MGHPVVVQFMAELKQQGDAKCDAHYRKGSSQYRGVSWEQRSCKWRVTAKCNGVRFSEANFNNENDAAKRFDRLQISWHGRCTRSLMSCSCGSCSAACFIAP
jgi:hypothetical protein